MVAPTPMTEIKSNYQGVKAPKMVDGVLKISKPIDRNSKTITINGTNEYFFPLAVLGRKEVTYSFDDIANVVLERSLESIYIVLLALKDGSRVRFIRIPQALLVVKLEFYAIHEARFGESRYYTKPTLQAHVLNPSQYYDPAMD